jgi:hypothetical protein
VAGTSVRSGQASSLVHLMRHHQQRDCWLGNLAVRSRLQRTAPIGSLNENDESDLLPHQEGHHDGQAGKLPASCGRNQVTRSGPGTDE